MNKKIIFIVLIVLLVPTALAAAWFFSVSGSGYTVNNVSVVNLISPDGDLWKYDSDDEKEYFINLTQGLVNIEKQIYSPETWSLYKLELERTFDTGMFYLCLSQDAKNCLAYDENGEWYRISTDIARQFLVREELEGMYTNSTCPTLSLVASGAEAVIEHNSYTWNYLLADETYSTVSGGEAEVYDTNLTVHASVGFSLSYSITPDWCDVKIFEDDALLFSGSLDTLSQFSHSYDSVLKVLVSAEWYKDDSRLYYGNTVDEFLLNYDVRATARINKDSFIPGEIAYITLENAMNDEFKIETNLDSSSALSVREYNSIKYLPLPISYNNKTGEYFVTLYSDNVSLKMTLNVSERLIEDAEVKLVDSSATEYQTALESFMDDIGYNGYLSSVELPLWENGFVTPVIKFNGDRECYWVSAPSYGAEQIVDRVKISVKNFGTHYIKSVDVDFITARAVCDGVIMFAGETSAFGNTVVVDHGFGLMTVYGHLDEISLSAGDKVTKGDALGNSSDSGIVMKNGQIFFAIIQDGVFVNPYMLINEQSKSDSPDTTDAPDIF